MCEYCDDTLLRDMEQPNDRLNSASMCRTIFNGTGFYALYVDITVSDVYGSRSQTESCWFKINFCPMCGRKLKGD